MDPYFQSLAIGLVFIAAAFGIHWFFMRDYRRWKRLNRAAKPLRDVSAGPPHR